MSTGRTVSFHTLGCKLNFAETSGISQQFRKAGYEEVAFEEAADIYILNTCSVTDQADKKCRKAVRSALRKNSTAKVLVIGCYAQLKPAEIANIPGVSMVLGAAEKFNILEHLQHLEPMNPLGQIYAGDIRDVNQFMPSYSIEDRTRTFLKVQDGCDYKCSFCTIPLARGRSRSGEVDNIVALAREIGKKGVKEIVLTGVNLGDFGNGTQVIEGQRPKKEALFIDLIKALDELDEIDRFRISSIEPNLCTKEVIDFVAASKRFMPHFHMPLQSGDNEILSLMKRRYRRELYAERVEYIKQVMPHACIGVDVIVGFPGETNDHFQNSFDFIHGIDVSYLHVFTYSERPNTIANEMEGKIDPSIRHQRSQQLRNLSIKKKNNFYHQFLNTRQTVLLEQKQVEQMEGLSGFTDNYLRVNLPDASIDMINTLQEIIIEGFDVTGDLLGKLVTCPARLMV
ncbi:MAG: tRNA (N(6)-L-threonylcarbamoyladenosine(37)-C(2))-methylthiotransferase MtaB [Saprospiraceae bacterium]|nr:tRNA (N(6)-L-threonylcarbamoyladenosine(37)-C(2))-methylthiotransferase MtaB [Saprospiraceae bacterium]HRG32605.1 tRNA (N(6)-L-threonylcarbamoyladenosine(37)-C(2))-methylthiotransferase MtaB [Saprospiraceae bacterium]